ncbi:phosphate acetyltransferase [Flavobacterium sp.]|jgi:phosphate acetyltransferase|uniref:phosphate acetyltransferase n=1 Tax=Flavobacterium sp. TaxID=239 RepID=UPI0037BE66ED
MNKGLYVATIEPRSGKSLISLGLMDALLSRMAKVAYYRPIINEGKKSKTDNHLQLILQTFQLHEKYGNAYSYTKQQMIQLVNLGKKGEVIDTIMNDYKKLEEEFDFVLVEGSDFEDEVSVFEFEINLQIAKNLGLPVLINASGNNAADDLIQNLEMAYRSFVSKEVGVMAIVTNKIQEKNRDAIIQGIKKFTEPSVQVFAIPVNESLSNPSVREVVDALNGKVLFGEHLLEGIVGSFSVGAMQLRNYLTNIGPDNLVITPGDRADIILGVLQAHKSASYPRMVGIVLTGGLLPEESIIRLIEGLDDIIPIISVEENTFKAANKIGRINCKIRPGDQTKIQLSLETFYKHIDADLLIQKVTNFTSKGITPKMFQYNLLKKAKNVRKHIVLPESEDVRILEATARLLAADVVDITLLGKKSTIEKTLNKAGIVLPLDKVTIIDPVNSDYYNDFVETFYELRKHKNVNHDIAKDLMSDVSYFGTMMVYKGLADGMVSGAIHTTQHTIRPALQIIKTKKGISVVSSVFFMCLEDRISVFGDCAINPNPTAEELAQIAISSAESSQAFGIAPKIAMLSYSSGSSGTGEDVERVRKATELVKTLRPDLQIEGPIQYDAAVDMTVGKSKMPDSLVAGQANVLIFPDLNTGNNTYKAVQRETGAIAIGPMLQGLNKPVNDLSRGCTVEDVYNTIIITAIQAQDL